MKLFLYSFSHLLDYMRAKASTLTSTVAAEAAEAAAIADRNAVEPTKDQDRRDRVDQRPEQQHQR